MDTKQLVEDMANAVRNNPGIDLLRFRDWMFSVREITEAVLGVVTWGLIIWSAVIVCVEAVIINTPPLSAALLNREQYGVEKSRRNWGMFVHDAYKAIVRSHERSHNVNLEYFLIKTRSIIIVSTLAICLFAGSEWVIGAVMKLAEPIVRRVVGM